MSKIMFASDIHGGAECCQKMLERFEEEGAEKLILLGDILYHGPRNDLPEDYAPKAVAELLNARWEKILCVRGNCDSEVDQMMLNFPIMAEYALLYLDGRTVFLTHGHRISPDAPPPLAPGDILMCGHTHVPVSDLGGAVPYLNPGSVTIPKGGSARSYMVYENGVFTLRNL